MVEIWGIFVVFSGCAAFQLTESRIQHAYRPLHLSASDELKDISNSISDSSRDIGDSGSYAFGSAFEVATVSAAESAQETQTDLPPHVAQTESQTETETASVSDAEAENSIFRSTAAQKRISLRERREAVTEFYKNATATYGKNYVVKTRDITKKIIAELEATTEKSDALTERLAEIKNTLKKLEAFDIESNDLEEATAIVYDLINEFDYPEQEPPELIAALEKVGWLDMRYELHDETIAIVKEFRKLFNDLIASLTPRERLREAGLVDYNRRFNENPTVDKWYLFDEFWTYFD